MHWFGPSGSQNSANKKGVSHNLCDIYRGDMASCSSGNLEATATGDTTP